MSIPARVRLVLRAAPDARFTRADAALTARCRRANGTPLPSPYKKTLRVFTPTPHPKEGERSRFVIASWSFRSGYFVKCVSRHSTAPCFVRLAHELFAHHLGDGPSAAFAKATAAKGMLALPGREMIGGDEAPRLMPCQIF
jgi:hypothetical protein